MCFDESKLNQFVRIARELGMTDGNYVFYYCDLYATPRVLKPWSYLQDVSDEEQGAYHSVQLVTVLIVLHYAM